MITLRQAMWKARKGLPSKVSDELAKKAVNQAAEEIFIMMQLEHIHGMSDLPNIHIPLRV
jgi:hypothetical protein